MTVFWICLSITLLLLLVFFAVKYDDQKQKNKKIE